MWTDVGDYQLQPGVTDWRKQDPSKPYSKSSKQRTQSLQSTLILLCVFLISNLYKTY